MKGRAPNPSAGAVGELGCTVTPQSPRGRPECRRAAPEGAFQTILWFCDRSGERGTRFTRAPGTLPRPEHVSSAVGRGQAWAGRWQEAEDARGCSQRHCKDAQSPSGRPAQPCCSPWLWGRCQLPKHHWTTHFSKGCSRCPGSCGHCPLLLPSLVWSFPLPRMAETGPKLCQFQVREAPGSHPQGHTADGTAVPAFGGFPWLPARACPGRSRSPAPAEQSQTPRTVNRRNFHFVTKVKGIKRWRILQGWGRPSAPLSSQPRGGCRAGMNPFP